MSTRTLYLLRHASAAMVSTTGRGDIDRPLSPEGKDQVARVTEVLRGMTPSVQLVLCSTAMRTRQTAEGLRLGCQIEYADALYHAGSDGVGEQIAAVDDDVAGLLVVGHAPGIPALAHVLADRSASAPQALATIDSRYPTATLCRIELDCSWADLARPTAVGRLTDAVVTV